MDMDPIVAIYGIAVEAIERLREHDSDVAESLKEDLDTNEALAFPAAGRTSPDRMWAAVTLYSQAATLGRAALDVTKMGTANEQVRQEGQQLIDHIAALCDKAEKVLGIAALVQSQPKPGTTT